MATPVRQPLRFLHPHLLRRTFQRAASTTAATVKKRSIPPPTPFVPTIERFLSLIGRKMSQHASKFTSWEQLFNASGPELKDLGIEPARDRKYLLAWVNRFREGHLGVGGDFKHVDEEGVGLIRVAEVLVPAANGESSNDASTDSTLVQPRRKVIINVPPTDAVKNYLSPPYPVSESSIADNLVQNIRFRAPNVVLGTGVQPVKGSAGTMGRLAPAEGLWEIKRGRKVDGGERRVKQVRALKKIAENKAPKSRAM